jgi:MOSC domain-containing protein YiiM
MPCSSCRFDAAHWSASDLKRTLNDVAAWFRQLCEGAPKDVLAALRPTAEQLAGLPRGVVDAEAVHTAWHLLTDAGRLRHALGAGATRQTGEVVQVSVSPGGVPKLPVASAFVTARGVTGDKQANRVHHGRPWQAVCLWSAEVVDALAADGHPLGYGSAGENLTLRGVAWRTLRPGVRLQVGEAVLETTPYCIPCTKIAHLFSDGRFRRIAHEVAPGTSRIYARVVVDGLVRTGDAVVVEPSALPAQRRPVEQLALALPV